MLALLARFFYVGRRFSFRDVGGGTVRRLGTNGPLLNGSNTFTPLLRDVLGTTLRNRVSTRLARRRHRVNGQHGKGVRGRIRASLNRMAMSAPHSHGSDFSPRFVGGHRAVLTRNITSHVVNLCTLNGDAHRVDS